MRTTGLGDGRTDLGLRETVSDKINSKTKSGQCPECNAPAVAAFRPFCSKRCADVDLARWLGGRYAIPGPPADPTGEDEPDGEGDGAPAGQRRGLSGSFEG